jgi:hypothetical protein
MNEVIAAIYLSYFVIANGGGSRIAAIQKYINIHKCGSIPGSPQSMFHLSFVMTLGIRVRCLSLVMTLSGRMQHLSLEMTIERNHAS